MNSPIQQFRNALADAGVIIAPHSQIIADGNLHRAPLVTDRPGQKTAWYRLHLDAPIAGAGGDWRQGVSICWTMQRQSMMTTKERAELSARILRERAEAQAEQEARHRNAADRAAKIWARSAPAAAMHPYLQRKGIAPGLSRQSGNVLVLPVVDYAGSLHGLQFIAEDGGKRFISGMAKKGHFIPVGKIPDGTKPIYISEGFATASTIQTLKPDVCVIAALDAGNLLSVAQAARAKWPSLNIVVCPDFDQIGQKKGREAAISARCSILPMPAVVPAGCTDWNDWRAAKRQGVRS